MIWFFVWLTSLVLTLGASHDTHTQMSPQLLFALALWACARTCAGTTPATVNCSAIPADFASPHTVFGFTGSFAFFDVPPNHRLVWARLWGAG